MSDFGFDAYALDDLDTSGQPHPLEIARDLIANGKPRAALELLGAHHEQMVDDLEYLLVCSAAWWANGDTLRAQQALQGAARLAPEDPRPLQGLGELLADRGEHDKAKLVLARAHALELQANETEESLDGTGPETEDDLIAFAERREQKTQVPLTPRQVLLGLVALLGFAGVIAGIVLLTSPRKVASPPRGSAPPTAATLVEGRAPLGQVDEPEERVAADSVKQPSGPDKVASPPGGSAPSTTVTLVEEGAPPELVDEMVEEVVAADSVEQPSEPRKVASPPRGSAPPASAPRKAASAPRNVALPPRGSAPAESRPRKVASQPSEDPPSDAVVRAELTSMDPKQLTVRADKLYEQGHTGLAAGYYRRALEIDPDYAPALVGHGRSILRAKKYADAMENATRALQLARGVDARPGLEASAIYQIGRVHYERGERDAARRLFRQSISLPGAPPVAWFYLGEALASDNSPAARQAYEKYLELVPEGHVADRARRAIQ